MKTFPLLPAFLLASAFSLLPGAPGRAQLTNAPLAAPPAVAASALPVYHPPEISGGILPIRVGGGSRGAGSDDMTVEVLVPDQIALTTRVQPSLYWYQSKAAKTRCEVTLTQPEVARPLLVLQSTGPTPAGIHAIRLGDYKVKLAPKVVYKWSVAVVTDAENRSEDIIANGVIEYREPSPDLAAKLASGDDSNRASLYAAAGIWYDALDALSTLIEKNPHDRALQDQRAALLTQVGLNGARIEETTFKK
jgi:Domain of Unknown Function (DUF928)